MVHKLTTRLHTFLHYKLHWAGDTQHAATEHRLLCGLSGFTSDTQPTVSLKDVSFSDHNRSPQSLNTHCVISGGRDNRRIGVRFPVRQICLLSNASKAALESRQPAIHWAAGLFPWKQSSRGLNLTTRLHLVPNLRTSRAPPPIRHTPSRVHGDNIKCTDSHSC
jgi:hypothetical protein